MQVEFWYEFASTYSYLAAMRVERAAAEAGVDLVWRPFLLGPIFGAQGWNDSPFNIYPAKGKYMWRDMARLCADAGLTLKEPVRFPQNGLKAARLALLGQDEAWGPEFTRRIYLANFAEQKDISDEAVLAEILAALGLDAAALTARANEPAHKERLKAQTEAAIAKGIFGAPSFVVGDELFWGNDRLEAALQWAKR
ncbi:2-hydroxychromene-2-carboxylate isomerase [Parvibaculum sp.]|uniref:2-hydroxychromene-2-carboxylate isomerase n=1 Tax=Parvibaculum sp. TaxID=2024848 RepID=UPI001DFC0C87|nr:2-hydroxychromene-2-carboxylate isomerase [Parvibaculum sp.]MBX3489626.1 2-hydroxychromene-2-carboxylate isomerase [Parvibaculum sp.]MCW5726416.1 2-hydroxychromene-2-carboxylate isomerase [Parvibaculum sp.]